MLKLIQPVVQALLHMDQPLTMDLIPVLHSVEIAYIILLIWAISLLCFCLVPLSSNHGGLSRQQTTFYKIKIKSPRSIQFTQELDQFSYQQNTNRNTLLAIYQLLPDNRREELPINNLGYVSPQSSVDYNEEELKLEDYPSTRLNPGEYLFLITNDIGILKRLLNFGKCSSDRF